MLTLAYFDLAGTCPVIEAHWGNTDLPESPAQLPDFLAHVVPADRPEVERLVRLKWA